MAKNQRPRRPQRPRTRTIEEESSGGGLLGSFRSGIKNVAGAGPQKPRKTSSQVWNIVLWGVIVAIAAAFLFGRFAR